MAPAAWTNLKECMINKPPLIIFSGSIVAFALTLVGVSLYVETHRGTMLNPDFKNWNSFYRTMSDMVVCLPGHSKSSLNRPPREIPNMTLNQAVNKTAIINSTVTFYAHLNIIINEEQLHGLTLHGNIKAVHLGFQKDVSGLEAIISLSDKSKTMSCVTLSGPAHLLPNSPITPPSCLQKQTVHLVEVLFGNSWLIEDGWCPAEKLGQLSVSTQSSLNVYLSEGDTKLMQVHIMYTTSFLCVLMLGLLIYAMCGKRNASRSKLITIGDKFLDNKDTFVAVHLP